MDWKDIRATIDEGFPMLIGTGKEDPDVQGDHWSTLYGYGTHYRRVFLGNQPGVLRNQTWETTPSETITGTEKGVHHHSRFFEA